MKSRFRDALPRAQDIEKMAFFAVNIDKAKSFFSTENDQK
jgi:hypothetical protein